MHANRDNREWMDHARQTHAEAEAAMRDLVDANFSWNVFGRLPWPRQQKSLPQPPDTRKSIDQSGTG